MFSVVEKEVSNPTVTKLVVEAPLIAKKQRQVNLLLLDHMIRVKISSNYR